VHCIVDATVLFMQTNETQTSPVLSREQQLRQALQAAISKSLPDYAATVWARQGKL
jgi:hypothetical protein